MLMAAVLVNKIAIFALLNLCLTNKLYTRLLEGGSIVGISSIAAEKAEQCQTNYSASKAAMDIAAQALSIELAKKNIRINTILPGVIATEMVARRKDLGATSEKKEGLQVLGMGQPDDIASAIAFLISDMSRFITGRKLFVDGGRFL